MFRKSIIIFTVVLLFTCATASANPLLKSEHKLTDEQAEAQARAVEAWQVYLTAAATQGISHECSVVKALRADVAIRAQPKPRSILDVDASFFTGLERYWIMYQKLSVEYHISIGDFPDEPNASRADVRPWRLACVESMLMK